MFPLTNRNILYMLTVSTFLHNMCQARSLAESDESSAAERTDRSLWQPKEGTRAEWMTCRGMSKDVCERMEIKKQELQKLLAKQFGIDDIEKGSSPSDSDSDSDSGAGECIVFTEEQLDMLIAEAKKEVKSTSTRRTKRTLINFRNYPFSKWSMPIPYMFNGAHDETEKATIRGAFQHWTKNTCIRFRELPMSMYGSFYSNFILLTNEYEGCFSNLGRINRIPQQINLQSPYCAEQFGVVLHEIGHSLGLFHEHSRIDRNNSIKILYHNIKRQYLSDYAQMDTDALGLPYNYGSVMHYSSRGGSSVNGNDTIIALDPLYQMNMGQRGDLSFRDIKLINFAYCTGICTTPLSQPCQRGGYQNPNNCSVCICPDGFSGQICDQVARSKNANCGGMMNIANETQQVIINSPGFDDTGYYSQQQECTWWIKAPENYKLELAFSGNFSIFCWYSVCYHWVEVKYKTDLGLEGARFCCYTRPEDTVISESNEMMIIFRSNFSLDPSWRNRQRGFQAIVQTIPPVNSRSSTTPTTASSRRASTPASTETSSSTFTRTSTLISSSTASTSPTISRSSPAPTTASSSRRASTSESTRMTSTPISSSTTSESTSPTNSRSSPEPTAASSRRASTSASTRMTSTPISSSTTSESTSPTNSRSSPEPTAASSRRASTSASTIMTSTPISSSTASASTPWHLLLIVLLQLSQLLLRKLLLTLLLV